MMPVPPCAARLPGGRLHLQHGPIDLIIEAFGEAGEVGRAYRAATQRFVTILDELCAELAMLRQPAMRDGPQPHGAVARRMHAAVEPFCAEWFITPMAAVAGAVADSIMAAMQEDATLDKAYINNGGDIALDLSFGQSFSIGLVDRPDRPSLFGMSTVHAADAVRGIATSGRHGRSFSLGIADAVTVLAGSAAQADAAATIIANAVDLSGHPAVSRRRAIDLDPQSDLGERLVTTGLGAVSPSDIDDALDGGVAVAETLIERGLIVAAALHLRGRTRATLYSGFASPPPLAVYPIETEVIHAGR